MGDFGIVITLTPSNSMYVVPLGVWFRVQGLGSRGLGLRVWGFGFRVLG
jgi:hypothetical protein